MSTMGRQQKFTVVLANLMSRSGRLNGESMERVDLAITLDEIRPAQNIILCGWAYRPDSDLPIAEALKLYVAERRPDLLPKLVCQTMSRDTVGDAFFSRILIEKLCDKSASSLDVVTSDYHVARTAEVFRYIFPGHVPINVSASSCKSPDLGCLASEERSLRAFRHTFDGVAPGDLFSIHERLAVAHPFYNGDVYPGINTIESIIQSLSLSHSKA